jgi:hypothetical protein
MESGLVCDWENGRDQKMVSGFGNYFVLAAGDLAASQE